MQRDQIPNDGKFADPAPGRWFGSFNRDTGQASSIT
jgi:hypothetical protein